MKTIEKGFDRYAEIKITSTQTMLRYDLTLSSDEYFALRSALANTLMAFHDTRKIMSLSTSQKNEFEVTKILYRRLTGLSADRLLKSYQETLDNPPGDECPF